MNPLSPLPLCSQLALSIDKGYRLPEPVEMNVYKMNPEELKENGIESLPESRWSDRRSERSTIVRQSSGDDVFDHLIELKKKDETIIAHICRNTRSTGTFRFWNISIGWKTTFEVSSSIFFWCCVRPISCEVNEDYLFVNCRRQNEGSQSIEQPGLKIYI